MRVLVESVMPSPKGNGYTAIGRSYAEAADVDGVIRLRPESGRPFRLPQPGEYVWARITKAYQYDLEAVVPGE